MKEKKSSTAVLLSLLFCGLGHIYTGERSRGVTLIISAIVSILLMATAVGFLTTPVLWLWAMYDAHKSVERIEHQKALSTP